MYKITNRLYHQSEIGEKIHSGQFMLSKYDEDSDSDDAVVDNVSNFNSDSMKETLKFIKKDHCKQQLKIDENLNTMFQYLSIAMSGKITNPKWNPFKGVKFQPKDKIRLNNIIWREYHMQFVKKLKPVVVQFASPLSEAVQINGNVVLEGKYWKKRFNVIVHQYMRWREFSKNRLTTEYRDETALFDSISVQRNLSNKLYSSSPPPNLNDIFMDLDDFNLPLDDISGVQHSCQIIQPQLNSLQPRMESSIDFLNDYFCAPQKTIKSQKPFSSETGINVTSQEFSNIKSTYFQESVPMHSDYIIDDSSHNILSTSSCYDPNYIKACTRPPYEQISKSYQPDSFTSSTNLGHCKTPNLLSILLQPLPTSASQSQQISDNRGDMTTCSSKQSTVITTPSNLSNVRINDSSTNTYKHDRTQKLDLTLYKKPYELKSSKNPSTQAKYQTSVCSQSVRMKHNLNTGSIVQEYLADLNTLLVSARDQNKISKAALLHKAVDHIKKLRVQKHKLQSEIVTLQSQIDSLQNRFSLFCSQLPATGVCLSNDKSTESKKWFDEFVIKHSLSNWKFYVFAIMFENLFTEYNNSVNTASVDKLVNNVAFWLEKECSLANLRLVFINGMRSISRKTSIVNSPKLFEEEVKKLIELNNRSRKNIDSFRTRSQSLRFHTATDS